MHESNHIRPAPRFIDLFAGIGGFHFGFEDIAECVFASEIDLKARQTYKLNFASKAPHLFEDNERFFNQDVTKVDLVSNPSAIPEFEILCGGFPCQPFSNAGKRQGFEDSKNRGLLFNNILHILENSKAKAVFLENVRGLKSHKFDGGHTLDIIIEKLAQIGFHARVYDVKASDFGLPQHRPRLFIVGFREQYLLDEFEKYLPNEPLPLRYTMSDVLGGSVDRDIGFTLRLGGRGSGVGDRRNWDEYLVDGVPTRINSNHALLMQGFPTTFRFPNGLSESTKMKQLGNSVAVPAIEVYAKAIISVLSR
jgi:DNA (cytosine-5)-methyltransferase 1